MVFRGRWDWTRNEQSAKSIMKSRLEKKPNKMSRFEGKLFTGFVVFLIVAAIIWLLWDLLIK